MFILVLKKKKKKAMQVLGCNSDTVAHRVTEVVLLLVMVLEREHLECIVCFWMCCTKKMDKLE